MGDMAIKIEQEQKNISSYEELMCLKGRVEAFAAYVRLSEYSIERAECAALLGFSLEESVS